MSLLSPSLARLAPLRPEWHLAEAPEPAALDRLASELRLPPAIAGLLVARGYTDPAGARDFLRPRPDQIHPPGSLAGMEEALLRLERAHARQETILIHGDFDVDGICATALLVRALGAMGLRTEPFIPNRLRDGYDLTAAGVRAARLSGATLIITVDCGIVAHEAVAQAGALGIDVIVTDHHTPAATLPAAVAVINPQRSDCRYPGHELAGVGVAYKVAVALAERLGYPVERLHAYLDLVALATVADLAPLTAENRALVRWGLNVLARTPNPGLRALLRACGLGGAAEISAGQVGFILAPRLNAAGRMGDAMRGVRLLLTDDPHEAEALAGGLELENRRRQELDQETLAEALALLEESYDPRHDHAVVLASEDWHPGVIGIVASRIVERIHRPTILVALGQGEGRGSGRSIPGFHLQEALQQCAPHLLRFGGHRAAAGCSLAASELAAFRTTFNRVARERLGPELLRPQLRIDALLPLEQANSELVRILTHFAPFGIGNPAPTFAAYGVRVEGKPRQVGSNHLKLVLGGGGKTLDAIGFGMAERSAEFAGRIDVAFKLEENRWRGRDGVERTTVQARLVDVRPAA